MVVMMMSDKLSVPYHWFTVSLIGVFRGSWREFLMGPGLLSIFSFHFIAYI